MLIVFVLSLGAFALDGSLDKHDLARGILFAALIGTGVGVGQAPKRRRAN